MSDRETRPIFCGACLVRATDFIESEGDDIVCPVCKRADSLEEATVEASKHLIDNSAREILSTLESVTIEGPPTRTYRWQFG